MKKLLFLLSILLTFSCSEDDSLVINNEDETASIRLKATNNFRGVNWACPGDNFQSGPLYLSGLSSSDNYSSAATVADRVIGQFVTKLGANSVRMPINETSVHGNYWETYTGAIDKALSYGKVILCYWSWTRGVPQSMNDWWSMWAKVINKYGSNPDCYFEVFNEPNMYSDNDLRNLYNEWVNVRFPGVPKGRIILDGAGLAVNVSAIGQDSRLSSCLLAVHEYTMFVYGRPPYTTEAEWQTHFQNEVGIYADRTVCTEWGYPNSPGSKDGVYYNYIDYNATSGDGGGGYFYYYTRGISKQLRSWGMGSCYWPGLRDGDWYSMTTRSGSGSNINLSIPNSSGLYWLQYAWGTTGPPPPPDDSYIRLRNVATSLYLDGMGRTSNGSNAGQWSNSGSSNQQWVMETSGSYVRFRNSATGLYLDGMGRTSNGSNAGQWGNSGSNNQQWAMETSGNYVRFRNSATSLYLDGMGRTSNGSDVGQWSSSGSNNQMWEIQ